VRQQAELLATALNNLQVQGATVVAHDLGGAVALQMALDQPQFVQRLVLVAPRLERTRQDNWGDRVWAWVLKVPYVRRAALWLRCAGGPGQTLERKLLYATPTLVNAETMRGVRAATHIEGTLDALEAMAATPPDSDLPGALAQLQAPVLIMLGEEDRAVSVDDLSWTTALPSVETVSVPDAGHFVHQEQGAVVSSAIIDASTLQTGE
jgi:pimeloyl-ACP methyl ester carboxylesterase